MWKKMWLLKENNKIGKGSTTIFHVAKSGRKRCFRDVFSSPESCNGIFTER